MDGNAGTGTTPPAGEVTIDSRPAGGGEGQGDTRAAVTAASEVALPPPRRSAAGIWRRALSLLCLLAVWWVASLFFNETVLPGPQEVLSALWENLEESESYFHLYKTVVRVVAGMLIALTAGLVIGLIMGLSRVGEQLLDSWVLVAFTIPSVVYGILCILWFGLNDVAAIIAIGATGTPTVALNMWQGVKAIDVSLIHMGRSFQLSRAAVLRRIVVPQVVPFILAALRYALGVSWKIATVVELIGLSSGVGFQLSYWFGLFNMTQVLAWTVMFTIVLLLIEYVILKPLDAWVTRWRPSAQR